MGMPMNGIPISFGLLLLLCGNTRLLDVLLALRLPEMHPGHEVILRPVADSPVPCRSLWGRGGPQLGSWAGGCWPWAGRCSRLWPLLFLMPALGCSRSLPSSSGPPLGHMKPSGYSACCRLWGAVHHPRFCQSTFPISPASSGDGTRQWDGWGEPPSAGHAGGRGPPVLIFSAPSILMGMFLWLYPFSRPFQKF